MEFKKNGSHYDIILNGQSIGTMLKDESRNYMFAVVAKFNINLKGYRNEVTGKTYKEVKQKSVATYNNLLKIAEDHPEFVM